MQSRQVPLSPLSLLSIFPRVFLTPHRASRVSYLRGFPKVSLLNNFGGWELWSYIVPLLAVGPELSFAPHPASSCATRAQSFAIRPLSGENTKLLEMGLFLANSP